MNRLLDRACQELEAENVIADADKPMYVRAYNEHGFYRAEAAYAVGESTTLKITATGRVSP